MAESPQKTPDQAGVPGIEPTLEDVAITTVPPPVKATPDAAITVPAPTPANNSVSLPALFRFSTGPELCLGAVGLFLAIISGAAHPVMTIVFGQLTQSFTNWGILSKEVAAAIEPSAELLQSFRLAGDAVKRDASRNAVYLLIIGVAQGLCAYFYMVVWNYVGEANSKRLRQAYLDAVLRQEIAYFDEIGAGEVATRIENDCHLVQDGTSECVFYSF
jgi:ATP-binding cassette subfamily B (MDR/TAP) protein 1